MVEEVRRNSRGKAMAPDLPVWMQQVLEQSKIVDFDVEIPTDRETETATIWTLSLSSSSSANDPEAKLATLVKFTLSPKGSLVGVLLWEVDCDQNVSDLKFFGDYHVSVSPSLFLHRRTGVEIRNTLMSHTHDLGWPLQFSIRTSASNLLRNVKQFIRGFDEYDDYGSDGSIVLWVDGNRFRGLVSDGEVDVVKFHKMTVIKSR